MTDNQPSDTTEALEEIRTSFRATTAQQITYFDATFAHHREQYDDSMSRNEFLNRLVEAEWHRIKPSDRSDKLEALVRAQADVIELLLYPEKADELRQRIAGRSIREYLMDAIKEISEESNV